MPVVWKDINWKVHIHTASPAPRLRGHPNNTFADTSRILHTCTAHVRCWQATSHAMLHTKLSPLTSIDKESNHTKSYQIHSDVYSVIKDSWGWGEGPRSLASVPLSSTKQSYVQRVSRPQGCQPTLGIRPSGPCSPYPTNTHTDTHTRAHTASVILACLFQGVCIPIPTLTFSQPTPVKIQGCNAFYLTSPFLMDF